MPRFAKTILTGIFAGILLAQAYPPPPPPYEGPYPYSPYYGPEAYPPDTAVVGQPYPYGYPYGGYSPYYPGPWRRNAPYQGPYPYGVPYPYPGAYSDGNSVWVP